MTRDYVKVQGMQLILNYMKLSHASEGSLNKIQKWRRWASLLLQKRNRQLFKASNEKSVLVRVALTTKNVKSNPLFSQPDYKYLLTNLNSATTPIHDLASCVDTNVERKPKPDNYQVLQSPVHLRSPSKNNSTFSNQDRNLSFSSSKKNQRSPHASPKKHSSLISPSISKSPKSPKTSSFQNITNDNESTEPLFTQTRDITIDNDDTQPSLFSDKRLRKITIIAILLTIIIVITGLYVARSFNSLQRQLKVHDDLLKEQMMSQLNQDNA